MSFILFLNLLFSPLCFASSCSLSPQHDAIEKLLFEGRNGIGDSLDVLGTIQRNPLSRQSFAAQWIRLAYHDMSTHNVDDGTGGIDYSIAYELARPENVGQGQIDSLNDFRAFTAPSISMSDVIAMGVVFGAAGTNGPIIPYRYGRIDATSSGRSGVPEPHQTLSTHIEAFRKQGFTATEMVQLVVCGHTLGGVSGKDLPSMSLSSSDFVHVFDNPQKRNSFDNSIVTEYLNGSSNDLLVINSNATMTSDARVFGSDGNVTMQGLSDPTTFNSTCQLLLERMINTVPSSVTLSDVVNPSDFKVSSTMWSVSDDGGLTMYTTLRILAPSGIPPKMSWKDGSGQGNTSSPSTKKRVDGVLMRKRGLTPIQYSYNASVSTLPVNVSFDVGGCDWTETDSAVEIFLDRSRTRITRYRSSPKIDLDVTVAVKTNDTSNSTPPSLQAFYHDSDALKPTYEVLDLHKNTSAVGYELWSTRMEGLDDHVVTLVLNGVEVPVGVFDTDLV